MLPPTPATDQFEPGPRLIPKPAFAGPANADFELTPQRSQGRRTLHFDFPGIHIGSAHYDEGPTGTTVIYLPEGARTATDPRGGAVGLTGGYDFNHAICLSGGSVYGLAAANGVADQILTARENSTAFSELALVSSAIIYDFSARNTAVAPDASLGSAAFEFAQPGQIEIGLVGAGIRASAGKVSYDRAELTGQGAAFTQLGDIRILAIAVPNPMGVIIDRNGKIVRGNFHPEISRRVHPVDDFSAALSNNNPPPAESGNTTVSVLITNVRLTDTELKQMCLQIHSSMHRAIQPFHSALDGDTLFTLTTDEVDLPTSGSTAVSSSALGAVASETMWDAVLEAAY